MLWHKKGVYCSNAILNSLKISLSNILLVRLSEVVLNLSEKLLFKKFPILFWCFAGIFFKCSIEG
jgi:hypothetical protein